MSDHWNTHAQQWQWIGSPLRPAAEDIRIAEAALGKWQARAGKKSIAVALLGVTPETADMTWPAPAQLVAVDHTEAMIRALWRREAAICADWTALPLASASQDVVVGDGCFCVLETGRDYRKLAREMRRVLRDDGVVVMRFFIRPDRAETLKQVTDTLDRGGIGNFHAFKWRLAMSLHGELEDGVRLNEIWDAWNKACPDARALAAKLKWRIEEIRTIDAYRGAHGRYTFPTLGEVRRLLAQDFNEVSCSFPGYELGERCPTLVLQPR